MGDSVSASPFADDELPPTSSGQKPTGDTAKRSTRPAKALTHLSCATFKSSRSLQAPDAVQVSLKAKAYAFLSMITGSAFSDGDHIADARAQVMTRSSNVGLIAALFLTIVVPIMYDAIYGAQTNAYMITDPAWVGISYFFLLAMSSWAFAMTSLFAILIILVTNQLSTPSESSYLFNIARAEFGRPVQYVVVGWNCMIVAVTLWLIIAFFNLSAADECEPSLPSTSDLTSLNVSSDTQSQECKWYPELFIALLCGVNALSFHAMNSALKLIAKLYKCRSRATSSAPADKDSVWLYDPSAEEIWLHLCEYIDCAGKHCHPEAFQGYMLHKSNAISLSYIAKKLSEDLFEEKVKEIIAQQHSAIMQKVKDRPSSDS